MNTLHEHLFDLDEKINHLNTVRNRIEVLWKAEGSNKTLTDARDGRVVRDKLKVLFDELPNYIVTPEVEVYWRIRHSENPHSAGVRFDTKQEAQTEIDRRQWKHSKPIKFTETPDT